MGRWATAACPLARRESGGGRLGGGCTSPSSTLTVTPSVIPIAGTGEQAPCGDSWRGRRLRRARHIRRSNASAAGAGRWSPFDRPGRDTLAWPASCRRASRRTGSHPARSGSGDHPHRLTREPTSQHTRSQHRRRRLHQRDARSTRALLQRHWPFGASPFDAAPRGAPVATAMEGWPLTRPTVARRGLSSISVLRPRRSPCHARAADV